MSIKNILWYLFFINSLAYIGEGMAGSDLYWSGSFTTTPSRICEPFTKDSQMPSFSDEEGGESHPTIPYTSEISHTANDFVDPDEEIEIISDDEKDYSEGSVVIKKELVENPLIHKPMKFFGPAQLIDLEKEPSPEMSQGEPEKVPEENPELLKLEVLYSEKKKKRESEKKRQIEAMLKCFEETQRRLEEDKAREAKEIELLEEREKELERDGLRELQEELEKALEEKLQDLEVIADEERAAMEAALEGEFKGKKDSLERERIARKKREETLAKNLAEAKKKLEKERLKIERKAAKELSLLEEKKRKEEKKVLDTLNKSQVINKNQCMSLSRMLSPEGIFLEFI